MSDLPPVPMPYGDIIDVSAAAKVAGVSDETIRRWCRRFKIGRRFRTSIWADEKWQVSLPAVRMVAVRNWDALEAFRAGDRRSDLVAPFLHDQAA